MDWVFGYFLKDVFVLVRFDGQLFYEYLDFCCGEYQDWGMLIFDYGWLEVCGFFVVNVLYWMQEFYVDGFCVDVVVLMLYFDYLCKDGEWEFNIYGGCENFEVICFLQEVNVIVYCFYLGIMMIVEEFISFLGVMVLIDYVGFGFGFKWNMGWMNDLFQYIVCDFLYCVYYEGEMIFLFVYVFGENYLLFISYDEVVYGKGSLFVKMLGDYWYKLVNVCVYFVYMWGYFGKKLLFMGQEFGQFVEWLEGCELDWWLLDQFLYVQLQDFVGVLNCIYCVQVLLWECDNDGFFFDWLGVFVWDLFVIVFEWCDVYGG